MGNAAPQAAAAHPPAQAKETAAPVETRPQEVIYPAAEEYQPRKAMGRARLALRRLIAVVAVLVMSAAFTYTISFYLNIDESEGVDPRPFNDLTLGSAQTKLNISNSIFQLNILITAALWGLVLAKPREAGLVFEDKPEVAMFVCSSGLLVASLICHVMYLREVSNILGVSGKHFDAGNPTVLDFYDPKVSYLLEWQSIYLLSGFVTACLTLISAHKLKGDVTNA